MRVKERCRNALIKFADMDEISAMSACIKAGINAEKYLERLAEIAENVDDYDEDFSKAISAAKEGFKLCDKVFNDDAVGRL